MAKITRRKPQGGVHPDKTLGELRSRKYPLSFPDREVAQDKNKTQTLAWYNSKTNSDVSSISIVKKRLCLYI